MGRSTSANDFRVDEPEPIAAHPVPSLLYDVSVAIVVTLKVSGQLAYVYATIAAPAVHQNMSPSAVPVAGRPPV